jgi:hypothetical protein
VAEEDKVVAEEDEVVAEEDKVVAEEDKGVAEIKRNYPGWSEEQVYDEVDRLADIADQKNHDTNNQAICLSEPTVVPVSPTI